jgi:agmatinase
MIKTTINTKNLKDADVVLISAPYEKTASSHKGTVHGPKAVIECLDHQIEFFDRKLKVNVIDFVKTAHLNLGNIEKLSPANAFKKINDNYEKVVKANKFGFILGGEHAVSLGAFKALSLKYNPKDVTILHIDAHCDLRNDDSDYNYKTTPSTFAHSTVMRRASELGYNIVQVGIRTFSKEEHDYFSNPKNKVKVWQWGLGDKPKVDQVLKSIKTKYFYLSIDVDGFDPAHMPGTGTPVQGGLKWNYGMKLIERAINKKELIGADIVEVSPMRDSVLTEYGAAQLAYTIITNKFRNKFK